MNSPAKIASATKADAATKVDPAAPAELAAGLRLAVMRLARKLRQRADAGITPSQLSVLATLQHHGPVTLGELAAHEQVQPPSMTQVVNRLEELGLAAREPDEADRRVVGVRLTAPGKALLDQSRSRKTAYLAKRLRTLDSGDLAILAQALPLLIRVVEEDA
jgi:DNA-binding MarR family transcriptional regulator